MRRFLIVSCLAAAPLVCDGELLRALSGSGKIDHTRFAFTITAADIAKAPTWRRGVMPPPLSREQAEEIARKQLRKYAKNMKEWRLRENTLLDMGDHRHWIYFVGFEGPARKKANVVEADQFNVPVLMNGTVIPPVVFVID
jgi:hypothetical protein